MRSVTDKLNRIWHLHIDFAAIRAVKAVTGLDLGELVKAGADNKLTTEVLDAIRRHAPTLMDIIWALCKKQAENPVAPSVAVDRENFEQAIFDEAIFSAFTAAFWEELIHFFRVVGMQPTAALIKAARTLTEKANEATADLSGPLLTSSPQSAESTASTPTPLTS